MERYARFVVGHPWSVLAVILLVTIFLGSQVRHMRLEIRRRAQLPEDHPYVQVQNRVADLFGGETTVVIGILPHEGDIFTPLTLGKIQRITRALAEMPGVVPGNLLSLSAARVKRIRPTADGLDVRPFMPEVPGSAGEIAALREEILKDPLYSGILVARDGRATAIVVDFDDQLTDVQICKAVRSVIAPEEDSAVDIALGGAPLVRASIADYTKQMGYLFLLAVVVIGLVHYEAFRTLQAVFLPLITALLSVVWSMGFLGLWGEPLDTWSALTPVVILAIAAGHAVQVLKRFYEEYGRGVSGEEAVVRSMVAVGPVMLTAGCIASAGFASLATFGVSSVRVFGICLAVGILSALLIEMSFIPACRSLLPTPKALETGRERGGRVLSAFLSWLAQQSTKRPWAILLSALMLVLVALVGALRVRVDNSFHAWFPSDSRLRVDDRLLNDRLAGTSTLYVLFEGEMEGALEEPEVLRAIGDVEMWLNERPHIGASLSLYDFVRRMHEVMTGEAEAFPGSRALVAQYLLLYSLSGPEDLNLYTDPSHRYGVLRAYAKSDEAGFGVRLFAELEVYASERFSGLPVRPRVAGGALGVQTALNEVVVREKVVNVLQVGAIILLLSGIALRSVIGGIFVIIPLAAAVAINLGVMGFSNTWLSAGTATVTAMAISIGADFAIYLLFRIREELGKGQLVDEAIRQSLLTAGRAICFVASAVVLGYLVLSLSGFRLWIQLGILTALMMLVGAIATLTLIPALVVIVRPNFLLRQPALAEDAERELTSARRAM